jgi:hypothetical protein
MKQCITMFVLLAGAIGLQAQSPWTTTTFVAVPLTATNQTSAAVVLQRSAATRDSYSAGKLTVTGVGLTTATFSVLGSADNGATYNVLATEPCSTPGTFATSQTVTTSPSCYEVNISSLYAVKFATSGTFTATSISIVLTVNPNAQITRNGGGGGGGSGVESINGVTGAFTFGAGSSCTGTSCTFPGAGGGTVSSVSNSDGSLTVTPTTGAVVGSINTAHGNTYTVAQNFPNASIPNATLENSATTVNGTNCALGAGCTVPGSSATAVAGDVTGTLGATKVVALQGFPVNNTAPITGQTPTWNGIAYIPETPSPGANQYTNLWGIGTSIMTGWGSTSFGQFGLFALLSGTTNAVPTNLGDPGALISSTTRDTIESFFPNPNSPVAVILESGENNAVASAGADSIAAQNMYMAMDAYAGLPQQDRILATGATATGTWTQFGNILAMPNVVIPGKGLESTTSGSTLTFNIPSTTANKVGLFFEVEAGTAGTFTLSIDGTLATDNCSSTTTFSTTQCGGYDGGLGYYREEFSVTPNVTHTVVVTTTNSGTVPILGVDWNAPATNMNVVLHAGVLNSWAPFAQLNVVAQSVVNTLSADGLSIFYVDTVNGNPGVNDTTDISSTPTILCPASQIPPHPNNCGHLHYFQTIINTMIANNVSLGEYSQTGTQFVNAGVVNSPVTINAPNSVNNNWNASQTIPHEDFTLAGSHGFVGTAIYQDASSGNPWSGDFIEALAINLGVPTSTQMDCFSSGFTNPGNNTLTSNFCSDLLGNTSQRGAHSSLNGTLASAATIAPVTRITTISGTASISTITPPVNFTSTFGGCLQFLASGAWTTASGGNITTPLTAAATVGNIYTACYVGSGWVFQSASSGAPLPVSNPITSATGGGGTGTVTCLTAACTNLRGSYSVAGGTFTTGTFLTLVWPTTTVAYACTVIENGGGSATPTFFGLGHSVATATGMTISTAVTILSTTVTFDYSCQP